VIDNDRTYSTIAVKTTKFIIVVNGLKKVSLYHDIGPTDMIARTRRLGQGTFVTTVRADFVRNLDCQRPAAVRKWAVSFAVFVFMGTPRQSDDDIRA